MWDEILKLLAIKCFLLERLQISHEETAIYLIQEIYIQVNTTWSNP